MRRICGVVLVSAVALAASPAGASDRPPLDLAGSSEDVSFARYSRFSEESGEALYRAVCQACHMPDGRGATGAGAYPALAGNASLAVSEYPVLVILSGRRAMPAFADYLSDKQVVAVVNFVRTQFGNADGGSVRPADVARLREAITADSETGEKR